MDPELVDLYVAAFIDRYQRERLGGQPEVREPGICGLWSGEFGFPARLLVTDDRGYGALAAGLATSRTGSVNVFPGAPRCTELLVRDGWNQTTDTAMYRRDLEGIPATTMPAGLTVAQVRRLESDPPDGASLQAAVDLAVLADPGADGTAAGLLAYLRSVSADLRLYVAVDDAGAVIATSGASVHRTECRVAFVNTHPEWRGRGVARALTAHALTEARRRGAQRASLDATALGRPVYERLGFEIVAPFIRFSHYR